MKVRRPRRIPRKGDTISSTRSIAKRRGVSQFSVTYRSAGLCVFAGFIFFGLASVQELPDSARDKQRQTGKDSAWSKHATSAKAGNGPCHRRFEGTHRHPPPDVHDVLFATAPI